ncbi:hypothetical protein HOY34_18625 [Xinfangfangia sp. D13-10-4-6]|uniref:hypothetical protein n=1 Tax=Pseudogemmobacter hezensis TaxID=2737662 RepID=UPI001554BDD3|nr:hypothetical protein [Pseudogemmobacter hezensis]NPD17208.1 hypothetical protein [Pseudogemmobacter hezensis]
MRWISRLFGRKPAPAPEFPHYVTAKLNAKLQPLDRGFVFEEPLTAQLEARGLGTVSGGGTMFSRETGIDWIDLEIGLHDLSDTTITTVLETLLQIGAPKGSELQFSDRDPIPFGKTEGLGIFLNGTDLPKEVYETSDVNSTIEAIGAALADIPHYWGYWQGPTETALYFYADSYQAMVAAVTPVLARDPLCEKARLEQVA